MKSSGKLNGLQLKTTNERTLANNGKRLIFFVGWKTSTQDE